MTTSNEHGLEVTIQDLFRLVTAMRAENQEFRAEVKAEVAALENKMNEQFLAVNNEISKLPTFEMVASIERNQGAVAADVKALRSELHQVRGEVGKLASRITRAGIPA